MKAVMIKTINHDPWAEFAAFIHDVTNFMNGEETLEGVEDPDEYAARTVGPMTWFGGPETSASIPATVVMDGFTYYTAGLEDVHESAALSHRDPDWNYCEFAATRFHVRTWETHQERSMRAVDDRMEDSGDFEELR